MLKTKNLPPIKELSEWLSYDPLTGDIRWKRYRAQNAQAGSIAGSVHKRYRIVTFGDAHYAGHRIAWLLHYGEPPLGVIDHVNGDKTDNRIENLRCVSFAENLQNQIKAKANSSTGLRGVKRGSGGKFQASISANKVRLHLGTFDTPEEAHRAYLAAKERHHPIALRAALGRE